jgi:hypothetical protein
MLAPLGRVLMRATATEAPTVKLAIEPAIDRAGELQHPVADDVKA